MNPVSLPRPSGRAPPPRTRGVERKARAGSRTGRSSAPQLRGSTGPQMRTGSHLHVVAAGFLARAWDCAAGGHSCHLRWMLSALAGVDRRRRHRGVSHRGHQQARSCLHPRSLGVDRREPRGVVAGWPPVQLSHLSVAGCCSRDGAVYRRAVSGRRTAGSAVRSCRTGAGGHPRGVPPDVAAA